MKLASVSLALVAAACGARETSLTATVRVDGSFVVVEAQCTEPTAVDVGNQTASCYANETAKIRIPAAKLGAGAKTVKVVGRGDGTPATIELAVDVPESAIGPYFFVESCDGSAPDHKSMHLTVSTGKIDGTAISCDTFGGARAKLVAHATPNAKLTIGGKPVAVPASGDIATVVDLTEGILDLSIDDVVGDSLGDGPKMTVPFRVDTGKGGALEGKLGFAVSYGLHHQIVAAWLRDIVDGKVDRPAFAPRAGRKTVITVPSGKYDKLVASDRRGTVREIGFIAVERETQRTRAGICEFDASGSVTKAERYAVELEIKVASTDGKPAATKTFPAGEGCPMFAMLDPKHPQVAVQARSEDIAAWLDGLAGGATASVGTADAADPSGT